MADPNTQFPSVSDLAQKGSAFATDVYNGAKDIATDAYKDATGFMKGIRSKSLPDTDNPMTGSVKQAEFKQSPENKDWRVKLSIPPAFKDSPIMQPLVTAGGLIFPYTPTVILQHTANYNAISPVHNNYSFFAYQNSQVDAMLITGVFYNQNELEAQYWLAVLHYLRSATKMFYGQDELKGNPPPIVKLNGYGDYVFKDVPCVITQFTVDMPTEVDYIAAGFQGGQQTNNTGTAGKQTSNSNVSYAPVESQISVTVQPIYSRNQVQQFSLNNFVNGDLINKGYI